MNQPHQSQDLSSMLQDQEREFTIMDYNIKRIKVYKNLDGLSIDDQAKTAKSLIIYRKRRFNNVKKKLEETKNKKKIKLEERDNLLQQLKEQKNITQNYEIELKEKNRKIFLQQKKEIEYLNKNFQGFKKFGSISNKDIVQEIQGLSYYDLFNQDYENPNFYVKWKKRSDGFQPDNSYVTKEDLYQHCPQKLLDTLQKKFYFDCDQN